MPPDETARVREAEQRRAAAIVGVSDLDFWDFPDSEIDNTPELRRKIADTFTELKPGVALTITAERNGRRESAIGVTTWSSRPRSLPPMTA